MEQTKAGGAKVSQTLREKYGDNYWKEIGSLGGAKKTANTKNKGFGSNRDLAKTAGAIGGRNGKRTKNEAV